MKNIVNLFGCFILVNFAFTFYSEVSSQVVINEILADPGMYDGQGAEWIELYNTDLVNPADISCYVITDGEEVIVIPDGTLIPSGGMLLIYNSTFFNCAVCNWDPAIIANLPTSTVTLDLSSCGCTNQTASSCFAVTYENSGVPPTNNGSGERIVLFDTAANIEDAIYYGSGARINAGGIIPESQISNSDGPADIIIGQHIVGNTSIGCSLPATNDYSMPAVSPNMTDNGGYTYAGPNPTSCSTSNARSIDGGNSINGSGFFTDNYPTPGQANTIDDFSISYTTSGGQSGSLTSGNATINICSGETINFSSDINGFNQIYNDHDGDIGSVVPSGNGSYIEDTGGFIPLLSPWIEAPVTSAGVTNLSYTTASVTANTIISFQLKENTQASHNANTDSSCATGVSGISGSGNGQECYIRRDIKVNINDPIVAVSYTCDNGLVTVTTDPSINFGTYNLLLDNSADDALDKTYTVSNSPFQFQVAQGTDTDYSLSVTGTQNPNCQALPTISGGPICVFTPACPELNGYDVCTDAEASVCPGDIINVSIDASAATDLPNGGTIEYVAVSSVSATDADIYASTDVLGLQTISVTTSSSSPKDCSTLVPGDIALLQFDSDGSGASEKFTFIALVPLAAGTSVFFTDNGWTGSDFRRTSAGATSEGTLEWTAPVGGTAAGTIIQIDISPNVVFGGGSITSPDPGFALTGGDNLFAFCGTTFDTPTVWLSGLYANSAWDADATSTTTTALPSALINGETALAVATTGDDNIAYTDCGDFSTSITSTQSANVIYGDITDWTTSNTTEPAANLTCDYVSNHSGTAITILSPQCVALIALSDQCSQGNLYIAARISPDQSGCNTTGGTDATPVTPVRTYPVTCPTAMISGEAAICSGSAAIIPVIFSDVTGCTTADITYTIDGVGATSTGALSLNSGTALITGLTTAGVYEITSATLAGCSGLCDVDVSGDFTLATQTLPVAPTAEDQTVCNNQLSTITATGDSDLVWYDGDPTISGNQIGNGTILNVTLSAATTYYVRSENPDNGCFGSAEDVTITIVDLPTAEAEDVTVCSENQIDLNATASNGSGGYTYAWTTSSSNNFTSTTEDPVVTNSATAADAGTYTLYVEDSNGCFSTDDAVVTINELPDFSPVLTQPTCTADGSIGFAEISPGTHTYEYSTTGVGGTFINVAPAGGNVSIVLNAGMMSASTYTIRVTRTDTDPDCISVEEVIVAEVTGCDNCTAPSITTQPITATVCSSAIPVTQNYSVIASNNGTGTTLNYQWQVSADGGVIFSDISMETSSTLSVTVGAINMNNNKYRVVVSDPIDPTNCMIISDAASLLINDVECNTFPWGGN